MVLTFISIVFAVFSLPQSYAASQRSAFYRDPELIFGNFKRDEEKYLAAKVIASLLVKDQELDCPFKCLGEPKCFSFNVAPYPDSTGLYLCEVLGTDKYRAKSMLQPNATFRHYSPLSPACESSPCLNNGTCIPDFKHGTYRCDCMSRFGGAHCEAFFPKACKFDFEDGIEGWAKTGTAFDNQPTYGDNPTARNREPANQQGGWWIGGAENRPSPDIPGGQTQGDGPQGTLTTPSFNITGQYISFLIGGGCDINFARAELIVGIQVVRSSTGKCLESMARETWDVQQLIGQSAQVKLVDVSSSSWGHINFDDLRGDISCEEN